MMKDKKDDRVSVPVPHRKPVDLQPPAVQGPETSWDHKPRRGLDRNTLIFWTAVVVAVAQLTLPPQWKPFQLAGDAAAQFHGALFDEVNRKNLELAQQQAIAQKMADLQAEYSSWKGMCSLTGAFDPGLGQACMMAADSYYQNALRQIRRSDLMYR